MARTIELHAGACERLGYGEGIGRAAALDEVRAACL